MKRFMFALGLLATVAVAESEGAYLVIRIVLESGNLEPAATPSSGLNGSGGNPPPVGGPTTGGTNKSGGSSLGPGPMGGSSGSSLGPPGGGPGPKGSSGSSLGPPPSGSGGSSLGPPGGSGPGPMGSGPGGLSSGPGPGGAAGAGGGVKHDPTRSLYVVVPYTNDIAKHLPFYGAKKVPPQSQNPMWQPAIRHAYGQANLLFDNVSIQLYLDLGPSVPKGSKTRLQEIVEKHAKLGPAPDGQQILDLVTKSLEYGFVAEAMKYSDELVAAVAEKKIRTTPQVEAFLAAYAKIKDDITRPSRAPSDGPAWKDRIGFAYSNVRDFSSPHYHVFYWEGMDAEMNRRVAQLEDNFKAFFLMHAVQGIAIPVPEKPQLVILAKSTTDVRKLSASMDGTAAIADGFYCPDHGIVVLSPERLDAVSQTFNRQIQDMFRQGVGRAQLLAGEGPKLDSKGMVKDSKTPEDVARMMTWVAAERFAEEEGEWSAVSREGTRQLLHATGLLPQHVALPHWLSEGSANFYHRPKGPVFSKTADDKDEITISLTTGYGGPNYVRQKQFNDMVKHGQFSAKPTEKPDAGQVLKNVITDAYFTAAVAGLDADNPKLPLPPAPPKATGPMVGAPAAAPPEDPIMVKRRRAEFLTAKAHATAWSLYYFLAKSNAAGLQRYMAELGRQPRDLPLDEGTRLTTFANAFNIALDGKKTGNQMTMDELGAAWFRYLANEPAAGIDLTLQDLSAPAAGTGTGGPGPGLGGAGGSLGPKPGN